MLLMRCKLSSDQNLVYLVIYEMYFETGKQSDEMISGRYAQLRSYTYRCRRIWLKKIKLVTLSL
jgi:hypothetical protein